MQLGAFMGVFDPLRYLDFALEAEQLGCDSVWLPEHLVLPTRASGRPGAPPSAAQESDDHPYLPPDVPLADPFVCLAQIAARTSILRLGTCVYVPGLRHPFVVARAVQTLDLISGGRVELGVGAGWHRWEWEATGVPFAGRGRRLEETIDICQKLWSYDVTSYDGTMFQFDEVRFEPKPAQPGGPPIHIGGSSAAALDRTARLADGWMPLGGTPESIVDDVAALMEQRRGYGRDGMPFVVSVPCSDLSDIDRWAATGVVDRLLVGCRRGDPEGTMALIRQAAAVMC